MNNDSRYGPYLLSLCIIVFIMLSGFLYPARVYSAPVPPIHNSERFACDNALYLTEDDCINNGGVWSPDRKWADGWGVTDGKYGEFTCRTCHIKKSSNIKRVKPLISAPNGIDQLPIETASAPDNAVVFSRMTEGNSDFGNDEGGHTSSVKICEACHTNTSYHRYDTNVDPDDAGPLTAQTKFHHFNESDCVQCHKHADGFRPSCGDCHAYPPLWQSHSRHLYPGVTSNIPSCDTCHETSVHLNGLSEIRFENSDWMVSGGSYDGSELSRYTVKTGYNSTTPVYGSCDAIYCHSNAQPDGGIGSPQTIITPTWGDSNVATCGYCHESGVHGDTGPQIASGSHSAHLAYGFSTMNTPENPIKCTACHTANTIPPKTGDLAFNCSGCHSPHNPDTIFPLFQAMHIDGEVTINLHSVFGAGTYDGTPAPGDGYGSCANLYCHSDGTSLASSIIPENIAPDWGTIGNLECSSCHENGPSYDNGTPKANSHPIHIAQSSTCDQCHYTTTNDGTSITSRDTHVNLAYDVNPGGSASFTYTFNAGVGSCDNISCHGNTDASWGETACIGCHGAVQGARAAVGGQFASNSHHIQGIEVSDSHCYSCHWEANIDGSINPDYHGGISSSGSEIDLVIYGAGSRPTGYSDGTTVVRYTVDGTRTGIGEINDHCLACHSDQNSATTPFNDGKTPQEYAWDNTSIASRYSQSGTTSYGKYTGVTNAARKIQTKAYSAHGKATLNQGGWSTTTGTDAALPNTRAGAENVACFDCHNSHGSNIVGKTTSYNSATLNGGLLKETQVGLGGYNVSYQPVAGGTLAEKNQYNPGAGICFDCHMNADGSGTQPWGYSTTFGAIQEIIGYNDPPYFKSTGAGNQVRYTYKNALNNMGGHFGSSSPMYNSAMGSINGLCTPCHDPHGVSPTLGSNQQYSVPLLKGTWLTSPYREDVTPQTNSPTTGLPENTDRYIYLDQNTFGSNIKNFNQIVIGITQNENQFAGLCLGCHPKSSLTQDGSGTPNSWLSRNRVHETVKGWKTSTGTIKHRFSCSKCHTPHSSGQQRLMVTNCMDRSHKGRVSWRSSPQFYGENFWEAICNNGDGRIPGDFWYSEWCGPEDGGPPPLPSYSNISCHEGYNSNMLDRDGGGNPIPGTVQHWNRLTPWGEPVLTLNSMAAQNFSPSATAGKVKAIISWTSNIISTSAIDYGLTTAYGQTSSNTTLTTTHNLTLSALDNHQTYHVKAHSTSYQMQLASTADLDFYISVPPSVPSLTTEPTLECTSPGTSPDCDVTLDWNDSIDPDDGVVEYLLELSTDSSFASATSSGWVTTTDWTTTLEQTNVMYYWRVRSRDQAHPEAQSAWASSHFAVSDGAVPEVTLISPASGYSGWTCDGHYDTSETDPVVWPYLAWEQGPLVFTWSAKAGTPPASEYELEVYRPADGTDLPLSYSSMSWNNTFSWSTDVLGHWSNIWSFTWRVRGRNILTGVPGPWSELRPFTLDGDQNCI